MPVRQGGIEDAAGDGTLHQLSTSDLSQGQS